MTPHERYKAMDAGKRKAMARKRRQAKARVRAYLADSRRMRRRPDGTWPRRKPGQPVPETPTDWDFAVYRGDV